MADAPTSNNDEVSPQPEETGQLAPSRMAGYLGGVTEAGSLDGRAVWAAMGGTWGFVESTLPAIVFIVAQTFGRSVPLSVGVTAAIVVALAVLRAVTVRGSYQSIVAGAIGASIGLVFALASNDASNVFVPGFFVNGAYALVLSVSAVIGHPLSGYLIGVFRGDASGWRRDRALRRANVWATLAFSVPSFVRLIVLLPLWLAKADVAVLGSVKLALGLPLTGVALLVCYLLLKPAYLRAAPDAAQRGEG